MRLRTQDRPGAHDWENILLDLNMIQHDTQVAAFVVLVTFEWGAYILMRQYRNLEGRD